MTQSFRSRLLKGEQLLGTMLTLDSPDVAELLALTGFDWLFIDGEHGPFDTHGIKSILQAVAGRSSCLVRIPSIDEVHIKRALDIGADGIIAPQVNTAEQAAIVVTACRYPPLGSRGVGLARAHGFGTRSREYNESANDEIVVVVQAEHHLAVENIEAIVAVPGIDCILVGPNDLSASLGKPGQVTDPEVVDSIRRVASVCQSVGIPLGIFGMDAASVKSWRDEGFTLIVAGIDTVLLGTAARNLLFELQGGIACKIPFKAKTEKYN